MVPIKDLLTDEEVLDGCSFVIAAWGLGAGGWGWEETGHRLENEPTYISL